MEKFTPEQVRSKQDPKLITFQEMKYNMIFDIKTDFTRKRRFLAGGHKTEEPTSHTYSNVVSI